MKHIILLSLMVVILLLAGCGSRTTKLTKVDMETISVPDGFDYRTVNTVTIYIQGLYSSTVTITTESGTVLAKGLLDPLIGYSTLIEVPRTERNLLFFYDDKSVSVPIIDNVADYSFIPKY